jgi:hypothetical protein
MHERNQGEKPEPYQENPSSWEGGEKFQVILHEETRDGKKELSLQVFDGEEIVIIQFLDSVRNSRTLFLPTETTTPLQSEQPQITAPAPEKTVAPPATKEVENKPVKLTGKITRIAPLGETKKKKQPMLLFTLHDEKNDVERRAVAFDSIAQRLAAPETDLKPDEPIILFAWKHENTVHIQGEKKTIEDWYVQKAVYHGVVFEKPRAKKNTRTDTRR